MALKAAFTTAGLILLGLIWFTLAPVQIGGQAVYLVISGISMEPRFYEGDLVILHQSADYQIGDIAAYYDPRTQGTIIHQIIAREAGRFVLQGINNGWIDPYRPAPGEMQGKFWLHVPTIGQAILYVRSQFGLTLIMAGALLLLLWPLLARPKIHLDRPAREKPRMEQPTFGKLDTLLLLALSAVAFLLLTLFAFNRPLLQPASDPILYQQRGAFGYSAAAPPGIYGSNRVQTGEPVFRQLITQIDLTFDYEFSTNLPADLEGTYRLVADLGHRNGWGRRIELLPETAFAGPAFRAAGRLDLAQIQTMIDNLEQQAGLSPQAYTLTIIPEVSIVGQLATLPLQDSFAPQLGFELTPTELRLAGAEAAALTSEQSGRLERSSILPNTISLLGFEFPVATVRHSALTGLLVSGAALLGFGWSLWRSRQPGQLSRIHLKYGRRLVSITDAGSLARQDIVDVTGIDDLAKLADHHSAMILHHAAGETHTFWVKGEGAAYRYQVTQVQPQAQVKAVVEEAR